MQHVVEGNAPMFRQISDLVNLAAHRAVDTEVNSTAQAKYLLMKIAPIVYILTINAEKGL